MSEKNKKQVSEHILPTSANLMAIFFVLASVIKAIGKSEQTFIDEISGIGVFVFLVSSIFYYASMRSKKNSLRYEIIADTFFVIGLLFLSIFTISLVFLKVIY